MKKLFTIFFTVGMISFSFAQIPTAGLISSYTFNAGNADDEKGDNDGAVYGGTTLTEDRFGNPNMAYELDGIDGYIDFGDSSEFRMGTNDFSISFWFQYDSVQLTQVIGKRDAGSINYEQYSFLIGSNLSGVPNVGTSTAGALRTNGNNRWLFSTDLRGDWHHVVMNHDHDSITTLFVDGVLTTSSNTIFTTGLNVAGTPFVVGVFQFGGPKYFEGKIDDIHVYHRYLSDAEILDLYNAENPITSIQENTLGFSIFPNPTNDLLTIQFKRASNFKIYSIDGKLLDSISQLQTKHIVDCTSYPPGIYFIQAENETLKFVIEE
jgi:hypothetical protein